MLTMMTVELTQPSRAVRATGRMQAVSCQSPVSDSVLSSRACWHCSVPTLGVGIISSSPRGGDRTLI
jgi:hypothetical protein